MSEKTKFFVRAYTKRVPGAGQRWDGYEIVHFQDLVAQDGSKLIVIDTEEVPDQVFIDRGCFGDSPWRSKFANTGAEFNVDFYGNPL